MSGHSKFANIKHRKERQDAKRGQTFTKVGKEISIAAKNGGDPDFNPRLRLALDTAKKVNMPKDKIERAIKRGTGEIEGLEYIEIRYEGYGPNGVAFMVDVVTDNKNRSASDVRSIFSKYNGNLAESGAVSWIFDKKGYFEINEDFGVEEELMDIALEVGAEDVKKGDNCWEIYSESSDFDAVQTELKKQGNLKILKSEIMFIPKNFVNVEDEKVASRLLSLYEKLDENEDVQNVYANFEIKDELLDKLI